MECFTYNGRIYKNNNDLISINSRGLRFGDGLFETLKSRNNELQFADDHFERLWEGLNLLQFKIPVHFTEKNLKRQIQELLNRNGHNSIARVRLTVFRGDGGLYDDINHIPNYLIQTWPLPEDTGKWLSNGLVLGIYSDVKKNCDLISNIKHNNFLPYVMAALHAKKQKWNDAVLLNSHDRVCDTTIANIFLVKSGVIYTPSLKEGCIAGIIRKNLLQQFSEDKLTVIEDKITIEDLQNADEVFLSNSIYNIRWVQRIGDKEYDNKYTQKIFSSLYSTIS
jgi:branched-chain amino acid aminotransferase